MSERTLTPEALALRALLDAHRAGLGALFAKYGASNPRLVGSVARGTATAGSDIDILVDMNAADGNVLMRAAGLLEETRELLERDDIDVFPTQLLRAGVSASAVLDAARL